MDAGMKITSQEDVEKALKSIGFYRLRGYSFQLYDNAAKKYVPGTKFEDIIKLYQFDRELSALVFSMISKIEVALRVRLVEALLIHGEPLVLQDSSIFKEKKRYWQNMASRIAYVCQRRVMNFAINKERLTQFGLELLSIGLINDMYAESRNDDCKYAELATQEDFDRF